MERRAFTISRETWFRGQSARRSRLRMADTGKMCCLGQIALQDGATERQITDMTSPAMLSNYWRFLCPAFVPLVQEGGNTNVCQNLMATNDSMLLDEPNREYQLTALADSIGWDLTFVD